MVICLLSKLEYTYTHVYVCFLAWRISFNIFCSLGLLVVSSLSFLNVYIMILKILRSMVQVFHRMKKMDFYDIFFMVRLESHALRRKTTERRCHPHYIISSINAISSDTGLTHHWVDIVLISFLHCKATFLIPLFHSVHFGNNSLCAVHS